MQNTKNITKIPILNKVLLWTSGIGFYYVFTWVYDYVVVSFLLWKFELIKGGVMVFILSSIVDLLTLKFYDWFKKDWLALETLKDLETHKGFVGKIFTFVHDKTAFVSVVLLSLVVNPFVITAYMRKGAFQYNGMTKRDWLIFMSSSVISNFYWIVVVGFGVEIVKFIKTLFF